MAKQKELIKASTIARVTDKITGKFLGFLVKSNHTSEYYQVTCLKIAGQCEFFCNCEAKNYGCFECCHIKAVKSVCAARKELAQAKKEQFAQKAAQAAQERADWNVEHGFAADAFAPRSFNKYFGGPVVAAPKHVNKKREDLPLNGNGGFQLLKPAS